MKTPYVARVTFQIAKLADKLSFITLFPRMEHHGGDPRLIHSTKSHKSNELEKLKC